jgi:hypothetical protein
MMEDKLNVPEDLAPELSDEFLKEIDKAAAETEVEFGDIITESGPDLDLSELPPELLAQLAAQREKWKHKGGTKSVVPRAVRNKKRKAQRAARKITRQTGGGRTTAKRTRAA